MADALTGLGLTGVIESVVPPVEEREDLTEREIHVFVDTRSTTIHARGCKRSELGVWVAILDPLVKGTEAAQAEANNVIVDTIVNGLLGKRTGGTIDGFCTAAEQLGVLSPRHWHEYRQFATFVKLTIEV